MQENGLLEPEAARKLGIRCFNDAWIFMDKQGRSQEDELDMLHAAHASYWFWRSYPGHTQENLSIGLWQIARAYALAGDGAMAARYGERCVELSRDPGVEPFYLAYGYEAAARGYSLLNDGDKVRQLIALAERALESSRVTDTDGLKADLEELAR